MRFARKSLRTLLMVLLLLIGGAMLNVGVAWGCCMYGYRDATANVSLRRPPNSEELAWWHSVNAPKGIMVPYEIWPTKVVGYVEVRHLGHGPIVTRPNGDQVEITSSANWNEAGWPLRTVRGVWFGIPDTASGKWRSESRGASRMPWPVLSSIFPKRSAYVPWWPLWPGFAINTLFYAAILWLLFAAPVLVRRRIRIKRGRCPACAYPVGSSAVCTECGMPVNPRGDATHI